MSLRKTNFWSFKINVSRANNNSSWYDTIKTILLSYIQILNLSPFYEDIEFYNKFMKTHGILNNREKD